MQEIAMAEPKRRLPPGHLMAGKHPPPEVPSTHPAHVRRQQLGRYAAAVVCCASLHAKDVEPAGNVVHILEREHTTVVGVLLMATLGAVKIPLAPRHSFPSSLVYEPPLDRTANGRIGRAQEVIQRDYSYLGTDADSHQRPVRRSYHRNEDRPQGEYVDARSPALSLVVRLLPAVVQLGEHEPAEEVHSRRRRVSSRVSAWRLCRRVVYPFMTSSFIHFPGSRFETFLWLRGTASMYVIGNSAEAHLARNMALTAVIAACVSRDVGSEVSSTTGSSSSDFLSADGTIYAIRTCHLQRVLGTRQESTPLTTYSPTAARGAGSTLAPLPSRRRASATPRMASLPSSCGAASATSRAGSSGEISIQSPSILGAASSTLRTGDDSKKVGAVAVREWRQRTNLADLHRS